MSNLENTVEHTTTQSAEEPTAVSASHPEVEKFDRATIVRMIGQKLTQGRADKGLSIEEASSRLKVGAPKLLAIEAGDVGELPDFTFTKAVMRSYAKALNVDIEGLLNQLRQHEPELTVGLKHEGGLGETYNPGTLISRVDKKLIVKVLSGVALLGMAFAVYTALQSMGTKKLNDTSVDATASSVLVASAPVAVAPMMPTVVAASDTVVVASAVAPVVASTTVSPVSAATASSAQVIGTGDAAFHVRLNKDSWLDIRDNAGKSLTNGLVKAGADVTVRGVAPLRVMIGNVSGVEAIDFQGAKVSLEPFVRSNVARMTLPPTQP